MMIPPRPMYRVVAVAKMIMMPTMAASCEPVPMSAQKRASWAGGRKTSPWTCFHPDSSNS